MKKFAVILVSLFMSATVFANDGEHDGGQQDGDNSQQQEESGLLGVWRTERPLAQTPHAIATGVVAFEDGSITFETTCSYTHGPVIKATVTSEVEYRKNHFYIPHTVQVRENRHGYTCDAYLGQGRYGVAFHGDNKVVLFNRAHNWRMTLIR